MNIYSHKKYLNIIKSVAIENKYTKWYCNLISAAVERAPNRKIAMSILGYTEGHHILPKSFRMGGEKDETNIAFLTAREHYIAHWLLCKMVEDNFRFKMIKAFALFQNVKPSKNPKTQYINSAGYEFLKREHSNIMKSNNPMHDPEICKRAAERMKQSFTDERRKRMSEIQTGRLNHISEEGRQRLSDLWVGKKKGPRTKEHTLNQKKAAQQFTYITPDGTFESSVDVGKHYNISPVAVMYRCRKWQAHGWKKIPVQSTNL